LLTLGIVRRQVKLEPGVGVVVNKRETASLSGSRKLGNSSYRSRTSERLSCDIAAQYLGTRKGDACQPPTQDLGPVAHAALLN
jgi:hypothetical protein